MRKKLRYRAHSMMASPEISGALNGYSINFLIAEHFTPDGRSSRKLTAIEVQLLSKMPFEGGIASGGMVSLIQSIRLKEETKPNHPKWDKNYIAASSSGAAMEAYLTPERIDALTSLMKIRNGWVILIFRLLWDLNRREVYPRCSFHPAITLVAYSTPLKLKQ